MNTVFSGFLGARSFLSKRNFQVLAYLLSVSLLLAMVSLLAVSSVSAETDKGPTKLASADNAVPLSHEALIDALLRRMSSPDERTRLEAGLALRKTAKLSDVPLLVKIL